MSSGGGRYRFSDRFIRVTTWWLIGVMVVSIGLGFLLGAISYGLEGDARDVLSVVAVWLVFGGIGLPLLTAAVLGGEAIKRGGGVIGFFLIVGLGSTAATSAGDVAEALGPVWQPVLFWGGIGLMALSGAGFWIIGHLAGVPMWIQAPMLGSPRLMVRRPDPEDTGAPVERDGPPGARGRARKRRPKRRR
jgi:hypothetical protein